LASFESRVNQEIKNFSYAVFKEPNPVVFDPVGFKMTKNSLSRQIKAKTWKTKTTSKKLCKISWLKAKS
jgi:hypothetical protein